MESIEGMDELMLALKGAENVAARPEIKEAFGDEAQDAAKEVRARAPGRLKDVIVGKTFKRPGKSISFVGIDRHKKVDGETIGNVAHLVEYGHGGPHPAPPHPFFRPGIAAFSFGKHVAIGVSKGLNALWK